jgi:WD40 repeat protein
MDRVIAHFRLLDRIGAGGCGQVYRAQDTRLGRVVALKTLDDRAQIYKERLIVEARLAASINHPNIATIHDVIESDGQSFIVMEYVEGTTLAQRIAQGPLSLDEALRVIIQTADALASAHARGVIHCDIKSSNIMLTIEGAVKVLDFGLARCSQPSAQKHAGIEGTPACMSPEQLRGEPLDARTDIFSLGVVLYEVLSGRLPFESSGYLQKAILSGEPVPLGLIRKDIPLDLEAIVRRSLEKDPRARYQTIEPMLKELKKLNDLLFSDRHNAFEPVAQSMEPPRENFSRRAARHRKWFLASGIFLALLAALDGALLYPPFSEWQRDAALLALAAVYLIAYFRLRLRSTAFSSVSEATAAFRGLLPFQEVDRDHFYGREADTLTLFERVAHSEFRFGVVFGESGCGKTSLLRAGLMPRLWEAGYVPVYCRSYKDPVVAIVEECRRQTQVEPCAGEDVIDHLRRASRSESAILVIICDQFEEFFVNFKTSEEREPFASLVAACHNDAALDVKFLFSMRSDFLYQINAEFGERIEEPLLSARIFHLRNFDVEKAEEVIEKSARRAGLPLEAGLARYVARDLQTDGVVLPSELQIIGERLQSKRIYTVHQYRRAGGKEPLMHSFLEDVISGSGDQEGARLLLRTLISDENTRATLPLDEIVKRMQRSRSTVERLLALFVESRLIREIQEDEPWRYELMHEYLIEKINHLTGHALNATQRANRLLRQYLSQYTVDHSARIPLKHLWFIRRYADLERGELWRRSWQRGLLKAIALAILLAAITTLVAAWASVREEWEEVRLKDGHTAAVRRAAFSTDGKLLVSVGEDHQVIVWDFSSRERLATFTDHTDWVTSVAFSPDGKWFVTASKDRTAIVWDAERLEKAAVLIGHPAGIYAAAFSPDGRLLVTSGARGEPPEDGTIVWRAGDWQRIMTLSFGAGGAHNILFSRDGRYVIFHSSSPNTWDLKTGRQTADQFDPAWSGNNAAISPDGKLLVSTDSDGSVTFVDMERRRRIGRYPVHQDNGRAVAFSPNGRLVATGAEVVILWDAITREKIAPLDYPSIVWSASFSPDGRWLVSTHGDGTIQVWDVKERRRETGFNEHADSVRAAAWSRDGNRIVTAGEDRSIIIWNAGSGRKEKVLMGSATRVVGAGFSPDGRSLASADRDGLVTIWDLARSQPQLQFKHQASPISHCLALSPDGRWVATTHGIYESATGRQVIDIAAAPSDSWLNRAANSYAMAFSADGKRLAHIGMPYLALWDTEVWQPLDLVEISTSIITVSFSGDGKWLATGEDEGAVRLWSTQPLREVAILGRHSARIKSVAFSPDGRQVASTSDDQTIALWDVSSRSLITRIGAHTAPVLAVAFSPDGKHLVSGEHDKSVRIYTRRRLLWGRRLD